MGNYVTMSTTTEGKKCPSCGSMENKVIENYHSNQFGETIRKRKCKSCGTRWLTKEVTVAVRKDTDKKKDITGGWSDAIRKLTGQEDNHAE